MIILSTGPANLSTTPLVLVIVLALVKHLLWWVCYNCRHKFFRSPVFQPKCTPWLVTVYVAIANLVSTYFSDGFDWCFWLITRRQCWTYNIVTLSTDGGKDNHVTSAELFYGPPAQWLCTEGCSKIYNKACRQCALHSRTCTCWLAVTWESCMHGPGYKICTFVLQILLPYFCVCILIFVPLALLLL